MCGICGFVGPSVLEEADDSLITEKMLNSLYLRGPDEGGVFRQDEAFMAMRRLAVIDIKGGHQPLISEDKKFVLVYNGELYNHASLRDELKKVGHLFKTHSDTEVVLNAYIHYGDNVVNVLNGMFAFAIWDVRKKELFLARDIFGQKPLYYGNFGKDLVFGSDLRTLLFHPKVKKTINQNALKDYLCLRHVPGPETIIKEIFHLPPGSFMKRSSMGEIKISRYWKPTYRPDKRIDFQTAVEEFKVIWQKAVKRHLVSDVPLGAFLSGGIDSSLVVSEAVKHVTGLKTFSIGFEGKKFDETAYAVQVANIFGTDHETFYFSNYSLEDLLKETLIAYDQPFSDPAMFPTLILSRETRKHVTVALTGDGGDELFAGYQRYYSTLLSRKLAQLPISVRKASAHLMNNVGTALPTSSNLRRLFDAASRRISLIQPDIKKEYLNQFRILDETMLAGILNIESEGDTFQENRSSDFRENLLANMLTHDLENWLPDQMLLKVDRASMAYSLETRLPFLDKEIAEFSLRVPTRHHLSPFQLKRILRSASQDILPTTIANRKKHGFQIPTDQLLRDEAPMVEEILMEGLNKHNFFQKNRVLELWNDHKQETKNYGEQILTIIIFFEWEKNLDCING